MTPAPSIIETGRHDTQTRSQRLGDMIGKAEMAAWDETKALEGDIRTLAARIRSIAEDQTETVRTRIHAAVAELEAAVTLLDNGAIIGKDEMRRATLVIAASVHHASESLSGATDSLRTKLAHAIAPAPRP